ncbi:MAG: hypothetical protein GX422_09990 [Deltaproteobacteria bacterium]|jgi:hypothetical protein|nr:hypothetical protein [Deltaproteobacteria bacterium]
MFMLLPFLGEVRPEAARNSLAVLKTTVDTVTKGCSHQSETPPQSRDTLFREGGFKRSMEEGGGKIG